MDDLLMRMMTWSSKGFNCSQILILLGLEERGQTNAALVRSMAGLAYGCGSGSATCGALTGGCCLLAYLSDQGNDSEQPQENLPLLLQELSDWFDQRVETAHGGISCQRITGEKGPAASRQTCGAIVADTFVKIMEIIAANGL